MTEQDKINAICALELALLSQHLREMGLHGEADTCYLTAKYLATGDVDGLLDDE